MDAENAKATVDGTTVLDKVTQVPVGTPVTLTADPAPDGQKFAGWAGIVILNGVVQNEMNDLLSFPNEEDHTTANFEMPKGNVTVRAVYEAVDPVEPPVDPVDPVDPVGPVDPVLPGVIIGGAVILGAYETGTGIYRMMNMQGLPLPSDRIELAELVWERAGKPEPQNMTDEDLYADIDAADTDAQKAAHWMVEQELMKFDEDNNKFHPCFPVSTFLKFKMLTCAPIDLEAVDVSYLNEKDIERINNYHSWVYEQLSPYMCGEELEKLKRATVRI